MTKKKTNSEIDLEGLLSDLSEQTGGLPLGDQVAIARSIIKEHRERKEGLSIPKEPINQIIGHYESESDFVTAAKFAEELEEHGRAAKLYRKGEDFFNAGLAARTAKDIDACVRYWVAGSNKRYASGQSDGGSQLLGFALEAAQKAKRNDLVRKVSERALKRYLNSERRIRKKDEYRRDSNELIDAECFERAGFYADKLGMSKEATHYRRTAIELYSQISHHVAAYELAKVAKFTV